MRKQMITIITVITLMITTVFGALPLTGIAESSALSSNKEVRAIWLAYVDFKDVGLYNKSESVFRSNAIKFLDNAKKSNINTVYFHTRAFDDATYKSSTFKTSKYIWDKSSKISYDPLKIMIELAHKKGMELHAWMNPYRITLSSILDPSKASTDNRILKAVEEVVTGYDVDGIHFDDYFYNGSKYKDVPKSTRKKHVNDMVKKVYAKVHKLDKKAVFGISPQGNIENCEAIGADVRTWLSKSGYIDYIMPQIYWTDQWGSSGKTTMFSDRLSAWKNLNKNKTPMYVGLALYRTNISYSDDPGWKKSSSNLRSQLIKLREKGYQGYSLFSAKDLTRSSAQTELNKFNAEVIGKPSTPTAKVSYVNYKTLKVSWNKAHLAQGYIIYRSSSKTGKFSRIGKIKGSAAGNFIDKALTPGKSYYYKVRAYNTSTGKAIYSNTSTVVGKIARPATPAIHNVYAGVKRASISWKKASNITGYAVSRATSRDGTYKIIARKPSSDIKYVDSKLTSGKTYYYKLRTYKTVNGKRTYSPYTSYRSVKVK